MEGKLDNLTITTDDAVPVQTKLQEFKSILVVLYSSKEDCIICLSEINSSGVPPSHVSLSQSQGFSPLPVSWQRHQKRSLAPLCNGAWFMMGNCTWQLSQQAILHVPKGKR